MHTIGAETVSTPGARMFEVQTLRFLGPDAASTAKEPMDSRTTSSSGGNGNSTGGDTSPYGCRSGENALIPDSARSTH
jgi:hypothetical protein